MNNALELKNIEHSFTQGDKELRILRGANLAIKKGEIVALLGPSGAGKTTLLQIAGLLEKPNNGDVLINDNAIQNSADKIRTKLRSSKIGFIYQFHHLLSDFNALENLMLPQFIAGVSKKEARTKAVALLKRVGLESRMKHYPSQLSGGEQQRVAIARALVNDPAVLLADEPTGNLDPETANEVFKVMLDTIRKLNIGALIVTHNVHLANRMDRVVELKDGLVK